MPLRLRTRHQLAPLLAGALSAAALLPAPAEARLTPAGWRLDPAGAEFGVPGDQVGFRGPEGAALSPDGRFLLASSSGPGRYQTVDLLDLRSRQRVDHVTYDSQKDTTGRSAFYGVAFSPDGRQAWASGGGQQVVHSYTVLPEGKLKAGPDIEAPWFPAGLAYGPTPLGPRLYVANNLSGPPSVAGNPTGDSVSVIDPAAPPGTAPARVKLGSPHEPLDVALNRQGTRALVTNWLGRSVAVIDTATQRVVGQTLLSAGDAAAQADHPSAIVANPHRNEAYVANANSSTVSVIDSGTGRLKATIDVALVPGEPPGAQPVSLAVSPTGATLFVAEAGENAIAVVDVPKRRLLGFIPASWYPTDVEVTPNGAQLVVVNSNDSGSEPRLTSRYSPIRGSISLVSLVHLRGRRLRSFTHRVYANNLLRARQPRRPAPLSRIRHVIYVITENRTYDAYLGSLGKGDGDPALNLFGEDIAPNHRALARRFTLMDRFFTDAEVSADGHNWATQAGITDYVQKTFAISTFRPAQRAKDFDAVPLDHQFASEPLESDPSVPRPAAAYPRGYLWDNAYDHGVSFRDYGEFLYLSPTGNCLRSGNSSEVTRLDAAFGTHVDPAYAPFSLQCSDHIDREPEWEREFNGYVAQGNLPPLEIVRLPNDHTAGSRPGSPTPASFVADNDLALGRMVQRLSHSRYWRDTVMFVAEDDAQDGPDHIDAHRSYALAISPYTQHAGIDRTHYDTTGMIATIEDLLSLPPMTINDQRATRMWRAFSSRANATGYTAIRPRVIPWGDPGAPTNPPAAALARASRHFDLRTADAAPDDELNQAIWKSRRGRHSRMPAPRHTLIAGGGG